MKKKRLLLYFQAALCILWVVLMAAAAISIYVTGSAYRASGHPEAVIYTKERVTYAFLACSPVLLVSVIVTVVNVLMGIRDEKQDRAIPDPALVKIYKEEQKALPDPARESRKLTAVRIIRLALLAAALIFIAAGVLNGSMEDMLIKAVNLCTECIGLG